MIEISNDDLVAVANYLGKIIDHRSGKQILLMGNADTLDKLEIHPCNRNIDQTWVNTLKISLMKLANDNEAVATIYIAIVKNEVEMAKRGEDGDFSIKSAIIDGQHKVTALKQIRDQIPDFNFEMYMIVYFVENDKEIMHRIDIINSIRPFNNRDKNDILTRALFKESLEEMLAKRSRHRFVSYIWKSNILRDQKWTQDLWGKDKIWFKEKILAVSKSYKTKYIQKCKDNPRYIKSVIGQTIEEKGLYQLVDDTHNWLWDLTKNKK